MKKILLNITLFIASFATMAQVGIGTSTPEGVLDVVSTNSGLVVPRVANIAAVNNPVDGMIIYDLSSFCLKVYGYGEWSDCFGQSATATADLSDAALSQIGSEADDPDAIISEITIANLNAILPIITGIQSTKITSYQNYIDGNPGVFSNPATQAEVQAMMDAISSTEVVGASGKIWMDRNLGASQVATSSTDAAAYGDLYQWGRGADGHASRTSGTTTTTSDGDVPGHELFIKGNFNWRTTEENNLWQGVNGVNNPCSAGYRIPTEAELLGLGITNETAAFSSPLKLPLGGYRDYDDSLVRYTETNGYYISSGLTGPVARHFYIGNNEASMSANHRARGVSVRCIKD